MDMILSSNNVIMKSLKICGRHHILQQIAFGLSCSNFRFTKSCGIDCPNFSRYSHQMFMINYLLSWKQLLIDVLYGIKPPDVSKLGFICTEMWNIGKKRLGDPVLMPFLQDVIQFGPLTKTLGLVMLTKPQIIPSIFKRVGIPVLLDWSGHFFILSYYTLLSTFTTDPVIRSLLNKFPPKMKYEWKQCLEASKYGADLDYKL